MMRSAQSSDETDAKDSLTCNARSFDCIAPVYHGFFSVYAQIIMPWIDPYDFGGGQWVRAACSNVAPVVWLQATADNAKRVGQNRNIAESIRLEKAGNSGTPAVRSVSGARSARRLLRRGRKSG
jgi:hypothetical protein